MERSQRLVRCWKRSAARLNEYAGDFNVEKRASLTDIHGFQVADMMQTAFIVSAISLIPATDKRQGIG